MDAVARNAVETVIEWPGGRFVDVVTPASGDRFLLPATVVGIALGAPHHAEFRIASDRTRRCRMRPGDIQLVPAGAEHEVHWDACRFAMLVFDPPAHDGFVLDTARLQWRDPFIEQAMCALASEARAGADRDPLYCESIAVAIHAHLRRHLRGRPPPSVPGQTLPPATLAAVVDYVESRLAAPLQLADLARIARASPATLTRGFRQAYGMPPWQFVMRRRIGRACEMLSRGTLPLDAVAQATGFSGHGHFSRAFRRITGMTPLEWRNRHRQPRR